MAVVRHEDASFEAAYQRWMEYHIRRSTGERKRRLQQGLSYSSKLFVRNLWWPAIGNLDDLHPEYEVHDFKDGSRFLDFAIILDGLVLCIEIDDYGTHARNLTRWQFDDHLDRQNDLVLDDWKILRFSVDRIKDNPRHCQLKIQQALGKWGNAKPVLPTTDPIDLAIVKLLSSRGTSMSPIEISKLLGWNNCTIALHLRKLSSEQIVFPEKAGKKRMTRYILNPNRNSIHKRM
ncbi:DNA-binding response regulator [Cohnella caldifontis]|uniref:DNA-binding response regulator n=1 Tax=Cohnella caldifontis TaxID=3027471 RepID=UPI0023EB06A2|nr:DNA-binding response regulator [Cohnella sp. YIM B05605]